MKIAIIGSGISGLICGYLLGRSHDVTIFEAADKPGGHVNTVEVNDPSGKTSVDTGFIVFNEPNYPHFCRLLDVLQVDSKATRMGFSVRCEKSGLEYSGESIGGLLGNFRNLTDLSHWRMILDILRFHKIARASDAKGRSVEEFLDENGFGKRFRQNFLLPLGSALWSCPSDKFSEFPMEFVLEFLQNHQMLQVCNRPVWRVIKGGSRSYVDKIVAELGRRLRLETPIERVKRLKDAVEVTPRGSGSETYDDVILACHSDQSLRLLENPDSDETKVLESFPYETNQVSLHNDESLLPKRKNAWASWNSRIPENPQQKATTTYSMNILQGLSTEREYCVTLNQPEEITKSLLIENFQFSHPTYSINRKQCQSRHGSFIRRRGISLCGAYWGYGFHEDGLASGLRVCEAFGEFMP